jgi:hypothetical protein
VREARMNVPIGWDPGTLMLSALESISPWIAQPHPRPAPVLSYKLHAGGFEGDADGDNRVWHRWTPAIFKSRKCPHRNLAALAQLLAG